MISVISWAIMLNKYLFILKYKSELSLFLKTLTTQSSINFREESCMKFSNGKVKTMSVLLVKIFRLRNEGKSIQSPDAVINNAVMHEMNKLQKGMGVLATAANISPLIGLLGTVWGIMYSFINISRMGSASIGTVAPGIAEALITTIIGLLVAIPAMVGHKFLSAWINQCMDNLDRINEYALSFFPKENFK